MQFLVYKIYLEKSEKINRSFVDVFNDNQKVFKSAFFKFKLSDNYEDKKNKKIKK